MSTSPEDRLVNVLSRWLAGHVDNEELRQTLEAERHELGGPGAEAVDELLAELESAGAARRGDVEKTVRETLEALALG